MNDINQLPVTPEEDEMFNNMVTAEQAQMGEPLPNADIPTIINTICAQLQLLATVISQAKAQPETGTNVPTLQETVGMVLQQADWLKEMVQEAVEERIDHDNFEDRVSDRVSCCVDSFFAHEFRLDDHCNMDDLVADAVGDKLEEVVAEKLSEASLSISF